MMANPRRNSNSNSNNHQHHHQISISDNNNPFQVQTLTTATTLSSVKLFLKKPHAFPFLLSIFLFLTWVSLRLQHSAAHFSSSPTHQQQQKWTSSTTDDDRKANLVRFTSSSSSVLGYSSSTNTNTITKDNRGWLLDPLSIALHAGISGGAVTCASLHVGEIRPGGMRGNHRHYTCNETFLIWGAKTKFRMENNAIDKGYAEVVVGADEVAVAASPSGTAHALLNKDPMRTTFFLGCQDNIINYNSSTSDFNVWKDL